MRVSDKATHGDSQKTKNCLSQLDLLLKKYFVWCSVPMNNIKILYMPNACLIDEKKNEDKTDENIVKCEATNMVAVS